MREQWKELKETIIEIKENNSYENKEVASVCQFLENYINILEKQINIEETTIDDELKHEIYKEGYKNGYDEGYITGFNNATDEWI